MQLRNIFSGAALRVTLLLAWAFVAFVPVFFARSLQQTFAGWPINFWLASQGCLILFIGIVALYALLRERAACKGIEDALEREPTDG